MTASAVPAEPGQSLAWLERLHGGRPCCGTAACRSLFSLHGLLNLASLSTCRAHGADDGRLLQALAYHKDVVTCVAASSGELVPSITI